MFTEVNTGYRTVALNRSKKIQAHQKASQSYRDGDFSLTFLSLYSVFIQGSKSVEDITLHLPAHPDLASVSGSEIADLHTQLRKPKDSTLSRPVQLKLKVLLLS